jgi:hypothetical protein
MTEVDGDAAIGVVVVLPERVESSVEPVPSPAVWALDTSIGLAAVGVRTIHRGVLFVAPGLRRAGTLVPTPAFLQRYADRGLAAREATTTMVMSLVPRVVDAVLDQLDITQIVRDHIDVGEIAASIDIEKILEQVDVGKVVEDVVESMDLPAIVRESSGVLASETVRAVRYRSVSADDRVNQAFNRLLRRKVKVDPQGEARS